MSDKHSVTGSETWVSLGLGFRDIETLVRAWEPGDGVSCSHAGVQRREPCGPPVAVVETVEPPSEYRREKRIRRVICPGHLAGLITKGAWAPAKIRAAAEREAQEVVLTAHWDEYQSEYRSRLDAAKSAQLAQIPEGLREILAEVDWDGANDGDAS